MTRDVYKMVTDAEIEKAKQYADYGDASVRELIKWCLMKTISGFSDGGTIKAICRDLGLLTKHMNITKKGRKYLWAAFSSDYAFALHKGVI